MMSNQFNIILFLVQIICVLCLGSYIAAPSCGENSAGYEFSNKTGHCYKYHAREVTWPRATWLCAGEGARLAAPSSSMEEHYYLADLIERHPDPNNEFVAIGVYWDDGWKTVEGLTVEQAEYTTTRTVTDNAFFIVLSRNNFTVLYSIDSSRKQPFICEKAPVSLCF